MTSFERIDKYVEELARVPSGCHVCGFNSIENDFLIKAFRAMRDIAIKSERSYLVERGGGFGEETYQEAGIYIDKEFEEMMKQ